MARRAQLLHRRRGRRARDRCRSSRLVGSVFVAVVVGVVLIALVVLAGLIKRTATDYMVTNQRLYIRRGILSKKVQQTRIDRVQNVNTEQRFRDRLLRVGTVDFDTAGTDDSEFRFVGISDPVKVAAAVDRRTQRGGATESAWPFRKAPRRRRSPSTVTSPAARPPCARPPGSSSRPASPAARPAAKPLIAARRSPLGGVGDRVAGDRRERADGGDDEPQHADVARGCQPPSRRSVDAPIASGRFETKIAASRLTLTPSPAAMPIPSTACSGIPSSSAPSASRAAPGRAARPAGRSTKYVSAPAASPSATARRAGRSAGLPRTGRS